MTENILRLLTPVLSVVVNIILTKMLKRQTDEQILKDIIDLILDLMFTVERENTRKGEQKKQEVLRILDRVLTSKQKALIKKRKGTVENLVQIIYNDNQAQIDYVGKKVALKEDHK